MPPEIPGVDLGEIIGRGGNAVVHAGFQRAVQRRVAVKIDTRAVTQERNQRRFVREATAAGRISSHPHVVSLIDAGTTADHHPYLVMELCEGGSLADLIKRGGPLPVVDALDIGIAVTGALAAAHDAGILHRDVKPGNVLIDAFGTPRLSDFGLAARVVTDDETFSATLEALTPAYAPPEAFTGGIPTARSDVWSMGATIYAMLVGGAPRRRPDGGSLSLSELVAHLPRPLAAPSTPGADVVMPVLWRATAYDVAQRHASAAELRADLVRVRASLGPGTGHVGGPEVTVVLAPPEGASSGPGSSGATASGATAGHGSGATLAPEHSAVAAGASVAGGVEAGTVGATGRRRRWLPVALVASALVVGGAAGSVATWAGFGATAGETSAGGSPAVESPAGGATSGGTDPVAATDGTAETPGTSGASGTSEPATSETPAPTTPVDECWGGIVSISGNVTASPTSCTEPHSWESYAGGTLSASTTSARSDDVAEDPAVVAACTLPALTAYLGRDADDAAFTRDVIPPSEAAFLAGERGFACVASPAEGGESTTSLRD